MYATRIKYIQKYKVVAKGSIGGYPKVGEMKDVVPMPLGKAEPIVVVLEKEKKKKD